MQAKMNNVKYLTILMSNESNWNLDAIRSFWESYFPKMIIEFDYMRAASGCIVIEGRDKLGALRLSERWRPYELNFEESR